MTRPATQSSLQPVNPFPTPLQAIQYLDKYARFDWGLGRREMWPETVARTVSYLHELAGPALQADEYREIERAIHDLEVMPAMRLLAMAGEPVRRQGMCSINCTGAPVHALDSFVETLLIGMAGGGVGYSVQRQYVDLLPTVQAQRKAACAHHVVGDTTEGWAAALRYGLDHWFAGWDVTYDYSEVRVAGTPLRTKGGRASGHGPLQKMLDGVRQLILSRAGRRLRPVDAHRIQCLIGEAVVQGGVRRTAMLALFDHDDAEMLSVKSGDLTGQEYLWNANNSLCWPEAGVGRDTFDWHMDEMFGSMRGEPGIWNLSARAGIPQRRLDLLAEDGQDLPAFWPADVPIEAMLTNPCVELLFIRPFGVCNLTTNVAKSDDNIDSLLRKSRLAARIGTIQTLITNFPGFRPMWAWNVERERLLGVSLSGQGDCQAARDNDVKRACLQAVLEENRAMAARLGIRESAGTTCVKPDGNSSTLLNSSPGMGGRKYRHALRRIEMADTNPLLIYLMAQGWPMLETKTGKPGTWLVGFPIAAPPGAIVEQDWSALDQLAAWLDNKIHYTEHNPSVTVMYREDEVQAIRTWLWDHRDQVGGIAFCPISDARYDQMPYEKIDEATYLQMTASLPALDLTRLADFETTDMTTSASEVACAGGACLI